MAHLRRGLEATGLLDSDGNEAGFGEDREAKQAARRPSADDGSRKTGRRSSLGNLSRSFTRARPAHGSKEELEEEARKAEKEREQRRNLLSRHRYELTAAAKAAAAPPRKCSLLGRAGIGSDRSPGGAGGAGSTFAEQMSAMHHLEC